MPKVLLKSDNQISRHSFSFENVYDEGTSQEKVFSELSTLIQSSMDGYNVSVFGYGQTGAGKTHTMIGGEGAKNIGLLPRAVNAIFERVAKMEPYGWKVAVKVCFCEIYNDKMIDLLSSNNNTINDMVLYPIKDLQNIQDKINIARKRRFTAKTDANEVSSRSHAIFHIQIDCTQSVSSGYLVNEKKKTKTHSGTLTFVDLAGSERLNQSNTVGDRLTETKAINTSLNALKQVISALVRKDKHIPYRNSKLTYVLQNFLGKDSKTLVIVNVSPLALHYPLTLGSLRFGDELKNCPSCLTTNS